jgi:hypothetical protein
MGETISVLLKEEENTLNEVVIIGYELVLKE